MSLYFFSILIYLWKLLICNRIKINIYWKCFFPLSHMMPPEISTIISFHVLFPNYFSYTWYMLTYTTISSSVIHFSPHLESLPASGSFLVSQFFTSDGQSIGVSVSGSILPMNIQDWFPLDRLVGSSCSLRDSQESSPTPQFRSINSLGLSFLYSPTLTSIHDHWKNQSRD